MNNFLLEFHSGWRYLVILFGLTLLLNIIISIIRKSKWQGIDTTLAMGTLIIIDVQLLSGLLLWIGEKRWLWRYDHLRTYEHPVIMIIGIIFVHIAYKTTKKADIERNLKKALLYFLFAASLITMGILRITQQEF